MKDDLVKLAPIALLPTPSGCAVFLGDGEKTMMMYIDPAIGAAINVFFARLFIEAENEISQKKIVELDARPSDCLALAVRDDAPILILKEIWEKQADVTELLENMKNMQSDNNDESEGGKDA